MSYIGHSEFGLDYMPNFNKKLCYTDYFDLNHWLEQWLLCYSSLKHQYPNKNLIFICYEKLCSDKLVFKKILDFIELDSQIDYNFKLSSKDINIQYDEDLYNSCLSLYYDLLKL